MCLEKETMPSQVSVSTTHLKVPASSLFEERGQSPNLPSQNPHAVPCSSHIYTRSLSQTQNCVSGHGVGTERHAARRHARPPAHTGEKPALPTAPSLRDLKQRRKQVNSARALQPEHSKDQVVQKPGGKTVKYTHSCDDASSCGNCTLHPSGA